MNTQFRRPHRLGTKPGRTAAQLPQHRDERRACAAGRLARRADLGQPALVGVLRVVLDHRPVDPDRRRGAVARPARLGQPGAHDAVLPGRGARGQARARPRASCATGAAWRSRCWPRSADSPCRCSSTWRSTPASHRRTAGAPRCRPTRPSPSACWRWWRPHATRLRVRLLTIVVIDDLVALLVIATVYTEHIELMPLLIALGLFAVLLGLRFVPIGGRLQVAALLGVAIWVALHESGVDPVITGLVVGPRHDRLHARARRARASDRADAHVPRAADARARTLGPGRDRGRAVGQRTPPVPPASRGPAT